MRIDLRVSYALILTAVILISYVGGLGIQALLKSEKKSAGKAVLIFSIGIIAGALLLMRFMPVGSILIPVGFSFYSLQAIGYIADVYMGKTYAEKNPVVLALFIAFPLTFISGPIQRTDGLLRQLREKLTRRSEDKSGMTGDESAGVPEAKDAERANMLRHGLFLMAWGLFLKYAVADKLNPIVDICYTDVEYRDGAILLFGVVLYAFQLYADFMGYSLIAVGAGEVLGLRLDGNFDTPYLSGSVREFWGRWHISLSKWLRDYVYFPLGGSRRGTARVVANILIVFILSGIWHGRGLTFIVWGALHGIYRVTEYLCDKAKKNSKRESASVVLTIWRVVRTFILVDFAWLFFRAESLEQALIIVKRIFTQLHFIYTLREGIYILDPSRISLLISLSGLVPLFIVDLLHKKGIGIGETFEEKVKTPIRWIIYIAYAIYMILLFVRNYGYSATNFIYANF